MPDFFIPDVKPDPLLDLIGRYRADTRAHKIDLGVGVYRDADGHTPVLDAVKKAESMLHEQQQSKSYLGLTGDTDFVDVFGQLIFGNNSQHRYAGAQTPGGSGALRLAAELYHTVQPQGTLWVGLPTWPNHLPLTQSAGLQTRAYAWFSRETQAVQFETALEQLSLAAPGDAVLLHGCCHNPTGADLNQNQWRTLADVLARQQLMPVIDLAYHGLGQSLAADLEGTRLVCERVPQAMVAASGSKNFGLYRDRVGAVYMTSQNADTARRAQAFFGQIARRIYSMPPDHGAALVRIILTDDRLNADWQRQLQSMADRIRHLRASIAEKGEALGLEFIARQNGMFSLLPLDTDQVNALIHEHAVYLAPDGRINIAGCNVEQIDAFVDALARVGFLAPPETA